MRIRMLDSVYEKDIIYFGKKAFYVGCMIREGLRVPTGIALYLKAGTLGDSELLTLRQRLAQMGLDKKKLVVRSSAADEDDFLSSQAGKYDSYLNLDDPVPAINHCFEYCRAVIIQEMIASDYGGVCFSRSVLDPENITIEMCLGANKGVTQGCATIARVEIDRTYMSEKSVHDPASIISSVAKIRLLELAKVCLSLEVQWAFVLDVEWCVANDIIYYLQARPATALNNLQIIENIKHAELESLLAQSACGFGLWTDFSVGDMFRNASPLFMDILNTDLGVRWSVRRVFEDLGLKPARNLEGPLFRSICSRAYICVANYLNFVMPDLAFIPTIKRSKEGVLELAFRRGHISIKSLRATLMHFLRIIFIMSFRFFAVRKKFAKKFDQKKLEDLKNRARNWHYSNSNMKELYEEFTAIRLLLGEEVIYAHLMSDIMAGVSHNFSKFFLKLLFGEKSREIEYQLTTGLIGNLNTQMSLALHDLAHEKISLMTFLEDFGHRGSPDWDFKAARFREKPKKIALMAHAIAQSGEDLNARFLGQISIRKEAEKYFDEYVNKKFWRQFLGFFARREIRYLQYFSPMREETQSVIYHWIELLRKVLLEISIQSGLGEYIFYLANDELKILCTKNSALTRTHLFEYARERKYAQELSRRIYLPHIFERKDVNQNLFCDDTLNVRGKFIDGIRASRGKVKGTARVIHDLDDAFDINPHDVIITKFADPSFAPIMLAAAGLVLEQGSVYSHCAIVAREFGLPVVVNAHGATTRIKSGQPITLDADCGRIWMGDY